MTHLYLIRHGESVLAHSYHIRDIMTEDRLTPEGVQQAERLRDRLAATGEIQADVLLASSYPRARQTAEILAPVIGLPVVLDDDLQEMRPGDNGGMYWDEYVEQRGRPDHVREPFHRMTPTAETRGEFMLRVATTLHRIAHEHEGKTVVLVCHGGVVDGSLIGLLGLGTFYRPAFILEADNTSITHWQHFEKDGVPRWQLIKYNDSLHLRHNITT